MNTNEFQKRFDSGERFAFDAPTLVLASGSPHRARLLDDAGIRYIKILGKVDESQMHKNFRHENISKQYAKKYVKEVALAKLAPFIGEIENCAIVTADTVIWCRNRILEKPHTKEKCREQHEFISDKTNYAITAIAVYFKGKSVCKILCTPNKIAKLPDTVIEQICNEPYTLECAGYRSSGTIHPFCKIKEKHLQNIIGLDMPTLLKVLDKLHFPF